MLPLILGMGAASLASGLLAKDAQDEANEQAMQQQQQYLNALQSIQLPDQQQLVLQQMKSQGELTPQQESAMSLGGTEFSSIKTSPELYESQLAALRQMQDIGSQGGLTSIDRAKLGEIQSSSAQAERGSREALLQAQAARGGIGGGASLASQLIAQQGAAGRNSQQGMDVAALAQQRALDAISKSGTLGGQMQAQQFGQQADVASAKDAIAKFNTSNSQSTQQRNIAAANSAAAANLASRQNIANQNVGLQNQATQYNQGLAQQRFDNQIKKVTGQQSANNNISNLYGQQGASNAALYSGIGNAANTALAAYGAYGATPAAGAEAGTETLKKNPYTLGYSFGNPSTGNG